MRGLFKENIPLAELVLRIITGKPDLPIMTAAHSILIHQQWKL